MPDPDSLPNRAFTVVNHDLEDDPEAEDKKSTLILNGRGDIVELWCGRTRLVASNSPNPADSRVPTFTK
jgi:hypothetical protein